MGGWIEKIWQSRAPYHGWPHVTCAESWCKGAGCRPQRRVLFALMKPKPYIQDCCGCVLAHEVWAQTLSHWRKPQGMPVQTLVTWIGWCSGWHRGRTKKIYGQQLRLCFSVCSNTEMAWSLTRHAILRRRDPECEVRSQSLEIGWVLCHKKGVWLSFAKRQSGC
jgi:hypothetical protein